MQYLNFLKKIIKFIYFILKVNMYSFSTVHILLNILSSLNLLLSYIITCLFPNYPLLIFNLPITYFMTTYKRRYFLLFIIKGLDAETVSSILYVDISTVNKALDIAY